MILLESRENWNNLYGEYYYSLLLHGSETKLFDSKVLLLMGKINSLAKSPIHL